ncbi:hypothetical protein QQ008_03675 [Fulvivirgaceae bacterium BMA10]|uniref:Uncharacterized protein n=1 Tax=Splendidivirga corallicola TaxID=3051826 RepID=A0ABT8KJJ9_9BACT|nr:hypothetical protein [Fulvivirgaceae bacterium BMA10]
MRLRKILNWRIPLMFIPLLALSCFNSDDYDFNKVSEIEWSPSLAGAVMHGDLSIESLLDNFDNIELLAYPDGLLYFSFESNAQSGRLDDLITLSDVSFNRSVNPPADIVTTIPSALEIMNTTFEVDMPVVDNLAELDSVFYRTLDLNLTANTTIDEDIDIIITIPTFVMDGTVVERRFSLNGSNPSTNINDRLENLTVDLTQGTPAYNKFLINVSVVVQPGAISISTADMVSFDLRLTNPQFGWLFGDFLNQTRPVTSNDIDFEIFESTFRDAQVSLEGAMMNFVVTNEFGVPIRLNFNDLYAVNEQNNQLNLNISPGNPIDLAAPLTIGESEETTISVTNASELFDFEPVRFVYDLDASVLDDNIDNGTNFIADTSQANITFSAEVPLHGSASGIVIRDTVNLDLNEIDGDIDIEAERVIIKALIENEYPVQARIQGILTDENFNFLDSLLLRDQTLLVRAAETNNNSIVNQGIFNEEIVLDNSKIDNLFDASKLIIIARLSTFRSPDGTFPNVKFFRDASVNVKLGIRTDLKANINPNTE